ncbi:reverse transcriptase domain-containing protein [Tanacetum coccineum]
MTHDPMNQVIRQETTIEKNANNKRRFENQPKDNRVPQQPPFKKPDVARAYTIGSNRKKAYAGNLPYYNKCKLHHVGPCTVKCSKCKRVGHMTRDCKASVAAMNQRAHVANPKVTITCYECGRLGHFRNECQNSESSRGGIPDLEDTNYDIFHYMSEVHIDRITEIKTTQRQLETKRDRIDSIRWHMALSQEEFRQVRRDRDDTRRRLGGWSRITMTITRSGMTPEAIEELINRRVEEALAAHEATRAANALEAENQSQNGSDDDNGNGDNRDGENRNGGNGNGGNGNPN